MFLLQPSGLHCVNLLPLSTTPHSWVSSMALAARGTALRGASPRTPALGRTACSVARPVQRPAKLACRAIELDLSDPDTQLSVAGIILGIVAGLG